MFSGRINESVILQWNIIKGIGRDQLTAANLFLLGITESNLYARDTITKKTSDIKAKNIFGQRILADIKNDTTYLLTLQNLKYNDSGSFRLEVQIWRGGVFSKIKKSVIQLDVLNMNTHFLSFFT